MHVLRVAYSKKRKALNVGFNALGKYLWRRGIDFCSKINIWKNIFRISPEFFQNLDFKDLIFRTFVAAATAPVENPHGQYFDPHFRNPIFFFLNPF